MAKAQSKTSDRALRKLTTTAEDGAITFDSNPPFLVPFDELVSQEETAAYRRAAQAAMVGYRRSLLSDRRVLFSGYRPVDLAQRSWSGQCWHAVLGHPADGRSGRATC